MSKISREIGDLRVQKIKELYQKAGHFVITNRDFNTGVDLIVIATDTGKIFRVIESTNYCDTSYVNDEKFSRYLRELNKFGVLPNIEKELVISYKQNLSKEQLKELAQFNITLTIEGYQDVK